MLDHAAVCYITIFLDKPFGAAVGIFGLGDGERCDSDVEGSIGEGRRRQK